MQQGGCNCCSSVNGGSDGSGSDGSGSGGSGGGSGGGRVAASTVAAAVAVVAAVATAAVMCTMRLTIKHRHANSIPMRECRHPIPNFNS